MPDYVFKPKTFKYDTPLEIRPMDEKAFIIQQIRKKAYSKKFCMETLGFNKKTWLKYRNHAMARTLPKAIGQPPRINQEEGAKVAQAIRETRENQKSTLVSEHEGGDDVTMSTMLQAAADKSNPNKVGKKLHTNTVLKYRKQWNIGKRTAASRTEARAISNGILGCIIESNEVVVVQLRRS